PHHRKCSRTTAQGFLLAMMIRARSASGFCVGYPSRSLDTGAMILMSQTSPIGTPGDSTSSVLDFSRLPSLKMAFCFLVPHVCTVLGASSSYNILNVARPFLFFV